MTDTPTIAEQACNCARRHDPDQFDHQPSCAALTPESRAEGLEREKLALRAIKAVTATTKDAVAGLSRIMAITRSAGVPEPYSELMADPSVSLIVSEPRDKWRHLFERPLPTPQPQTGEPPCSCEVAFGQDPDCLAHGRGTAWRSANPEADLREHPYGAGTSQTDEPASGEVERDPVEFFETWWHSYRHANREMANYHVKKQIGFDAFWYLWTALRTNSKKAQAAPSSEWVSVPREPTEAMWRAAWDASQDYFLGDKVTQEGFRKGLAAMLAAAPQAQNSGSE